MAGESMDQKISEQVFRYDNYRFFLRDYFREMKRMKAVFSHRYFAQKAGFASSSFCAHVIEGKRNLTHESLRKMLRGLGLGGKAASYFEALVHYNQAKTLEDREHFFRVLERLRKSTEFYKIHQKQFAYYDEWYYPVIRELAVYADWGGDYDKLARLVRPSVTPDKARKALETLVDIGLLVRRNDGSYAQCAETVSAETVPSAVTRKTRKEFILRAIEAMERMPVDDRHVASATVALSEERYRELLERLNELRKEILEAAMDDDAVEGVYHFNFQAFPLSMPLPPGKGNGTGGAR
ncbi:MAG: TIGR02147 family protein [Chitinivibrionales bacterium]|nr:TIGR02147 family protein [Chitinivibrionales bacterium]